MVGTVKSYSPVKGFGFIIHPAFNLDIWFAREAVVPELRSTDIAGNDMVFELIRAPDGKPQARNIRPPGQCGFPGPKGGCLGPMCMGGKGIMIPGKAGFPVGLVNQTPKKRAWSPHAGSRAIAKASKGSDEEPSEPEKPSPKKSSSEHSESESSESEKKKKKKKKKDKKKKKKKKSSSSSSDSSRSRSRKRRKEDPVDLDAEDPGAAGSAKEAQKESKEVEEAKLLALQKLQKLQGVEPKENRAKEWRKLLRDWHPDKNPDKTEVATAVFQFLQKGKSLLGL